MNEAWRLQVDNGSHLLHLGGRTFPCDREIVAWALWEEQGLLLSADTDCLSLWDGEGLVRTARVGVYPQDMALAGDRVWVCGGADGKLHRLTLPGLREDAALPLPGMPERICLQGDTAHVLTLLPDPEVHTALLQVELGTGRHTGRAEFAGLPGAIAADGTGLWVAVSELLLHLPQGTDEPDTVIEGVGLARQIDVQAEGLVVQDSLEGRQLTIRIPRAAKTGTQKERLSCNRRPCE